MSSGHMRGSSRRGAVGGGSSTVAQGKEHKTTNTKALVDAETSSGRKEGRKEGIN